MQKPQIGELLHLTAPEREELSKSSPKLTDGRLQIEGGSSFFASVAKVTSIREVRQAYKKFLLDPRKLSARHNSASYRLYNPETAKTTDGWVDDGEHGAGRLIRNYLQRQNCTNIVVLLSRGLDGAHLGP